MNVDTKDADRGVYDKFKTIERTDGRSAPGEKHEGCAYFVLDLNHDPHAVAALRAYAGSCRKDYPGLAADLDAVAKSLSSWESYSDGGAHPDPWSVLKTGERQSE